VVPPEQGVVDQPSDGKNQRGFQQAKKLIKAGTMYQGMGSSVRHEGRPSSIARKYSYLDPTTGDYSSPSSTIGTCAVNFPMLDELFDKLPDFDELRQCVPGMGALPYVVTFKQQTVANCSQQLVP
jgi:hypothetical protein